ncbi:MAG: hypothetical protein D6727_02825 [Gammaproteobacteria bacterium]|nr:MAG: hypothetical protein D6727_02825 [Gammaproteobacteria bacterium]
MSDHRLSESRLDELLAGEAAGSLDADEQRELDRLLAQDGIPRRDDFLRLAGLLQTSFLHQDRGGLEAMPAALRERLLQQASGQLRGSRTGNDAELARPDPRNAKPTETQTGDRGESRVQQ